MKLNEKIFYCRRKAGLSQEALAEELGVSRQAVSKWETGDAVPEIGKLLALAKTFDVTTDWLLSEEEPESEATAAYDTVSEAERFEKSADEWMNAVPGVLGKLVRKFGWIAGIYIALVGGGFSALGLIGKIMVNSMVNSFNDTANSMMSGFCGFGGSSVTFFDENGNALSAAESAELAELFGMSGSSGFGGSDSFISSGISSMTNMVENNPVSVLTNIMFFGGLILAAVGIVFAVIWRKKSQEQK